MSDLANYKKIIEKIVSSDLPENAKGTALDMVAREIDSCIWNSWAKESAREIAEFAREESNKFGGWCADGFDYLGVNGYIFSKDLLNIPKD